MKAAIILILLLFLGAGTASALTKEDVIKMYRLNPIYQEGRVNSANHTVQSVNYEVIILGGFDPQYIRAALDEVNPFYKFQILNCSCSKGSVRRVTIQQGSYTHGEGGRDVSIWISPDQPLTVSGLARLIEHECDHEFGDPHEDPSNVITSAYTNRTAKQGRTIISVLKGNDPTKWISWSVNL